MLRRKQEIVENRSHRNRTVSVFLAVALFCCLTGASAAPTINVWYGLNQSFGQIGNPQNQINIFGNVFDGNGISSLTYTLNGASPITLSRGPDTRRLLSAGDFNIDINTSSLISGANTVVISATNTLSQLTTANVTVTYATNQQWPITYAIDWSAASSISAVAQVVDGHWTKFGGTVRPTYLGYDRLIGIGDKTWADYEVTVPITISSIDTAGFASPSNGPGIGFLFRWTGHTDDPISGWQPKTGYLPFGAIGWYSWDSNPANAPKLRLNGNGLTLLQQDNTGFALTFGTTYNFKMRVESVPGQGSVYSMKVWESGQSEPGTWRLTGQGLPTDPSAGSVLLVAHHANATFGNVTITPLTSDTIPPVLSSIVAYPGATTATIAWTTDEAATSIVEYGLTNSYELGTVSNTSRVLSHSIGIPWLTPSTLYHYRVTSADASTNTSSSADQTFTTTTASNVVSDHFNQGALNSGLWTFIDPLGDASLSMTGSQVSISVPGATSHDAWNGANNAPRIMQNITNANFEIEMGFDSPETAVYQLQGIIVEGGNGNYLRFDFVSEAGVTRVFAASFLGGAATTRINTNISLLSVSPLYLRVKREDNLWTESYSFDRVNWTVAGSFTHALTVTSVGPFIGNAGSPAPAFTGLVNFFVNTSNVFASAKAFLQGPFSTPGDSMTTALHPMLPTSQPYNGSPWNYAGTESVTTIPDSVVDWVLMELRTGTDSATIVAKRAGFIKRSGVIVDTNGSSPVTFSGVSPGNNYLVVRHRNHLPVMTSAPVSLSSSETLYDFTTAQSRAFGSSPMIQVAAGVFALYAGDANASGIVSSSDANSIFGSLNSNTYNLNDVNMTGIVSASDANSVFGNLNKTSQVP